MHNQDQLKRFIFEAHDLRGELVQLDASWKAILERHPYPASVGQQLGQAIAAVALLAATIKFDGSLILQSQSDGPLNTLVAQATNELTLRGLARWSSELPEGDLTAIYGKGHMSLTVTNKGPNRFQGIVELAGKDLAQALENYFSNSEQLASRLWLMADENRAAGLLIQKLPSEREGVEDWERITMLADTITQEEMLNLPAETLLHRLFHEEEIRLFDPTPVAFRCSCSQERISDSLRAMGREELFSIIEEQGAIEVDCDFCNKHYHFDSVDVEQLFIDSIPVEGSDKTQ
ncbi:MAG: Hsp33 family molecular chaperone HslO [Sedimenticola sp.]|nr:Hsp33 family molecular chaperone HslO [Sedimenticola sp.]